MELPVLFFDDGGVLNDNSKRAIQWQELTAKFFIPRFGGIKKQWMEANDLAIKKYMNHYESHINSNRLEKTDVIDILNYLDRLWLEDMFNYVNIPFSDIENPLHLVREADMWISQRVRSQIMGIAEIIMQLWEQGYSINTASGETSHQLKGYLLGMKLQDCFKQYYGPDLINTFKENATYYIRIFKHAKVNPKKAIVIDDKAKFLKYAQDAGASVIQSCVLENNNPKLENYYNDVKELPGLIEKITQKIG